jgi:hypothetical protein
MNFKLSLIIFSCFLLSFSQAGEIKNFKNCGSERGRIISLDVENCNETPCSFFKGQNATLHLNFTSLVDTKDLSIKINAKKFFLSFPVPITEADLCKLGVNCPVKSGDSNSITLVFPILQKYPEVIIILKYAYWI